jgi:hypothetical protein
MANAQDEVRETAPHQKQGTSSLHEAFRHAQYSHLPAVSRRLDPVVSGPRGKYTPAIKRKLDSILPDGVWG